MSGGALAFMIVAWGIILAACYVTMASLLKNSK